MRTFPTYDPATESCALVLVPHALVPILGGLVGTLEARHQWATREDWEQGYQWAAELQEQLVNNCMQTLVDELRALRGVRPEAEATPPEERTIDDYYTLRDLVENLTTGPMAETALATTELGALLAAALGYPPALGAALGAALPQIGGLMEQINTGGQAAALGDVYQLPVEHLVKALRGATEEPDEDAMLDQVKDFLLG